MAADNSVVEQRQVLHCTLNTEAATTMASSAQPCKCSQLTKTYTTSCTKQQQLAPHLLPCRRVHPWALQACSSRVPSQGQSTQAAAPAYHREEAQQPLMA